MKISTEEQARYVALRALGFDVDAAMNIVLNNWQYIYARESYSCYMLWTSSSRAYEQAL